MGINVAGLPPYSEQDTKKLISETVAGVKQRELDKKKKEEEKLKSLGYGKIKK